MKSLTALSILAFCVFILSVNVKATNITWGIVGPYDRLLAKDVVIKSGTWFLKQTANVVYPPKNHINYATITAIKAWDYGGRKDFGYISLVSGGPGYRDVSLKLKSQSGKGLNYTIEYYGR